MSGTGTDVFLALFLWHVGADQFINNDFSLTMNIIERETIANIDCIYWILLE
jgi:hypothetical protein